MKKKTHHIKKQEVNLDFETEKNARQWNRRFADFYYDDILPPFSSLLDNTIPDDRSYVIDRLEIDLGTIHMDEFQAVFLEKAEEELSRILKNGAMPGPSSEKKDGTVSESKSVSKESDREHIKPLERGKPDREEQEKNLRIKDSEEHLLQSFIHFLDYGVLLWNSGFDTLEELEAGIRQEMGIEKLTAQAEFQKRMRKSSVRQRFYFQFSKTFTEEIFNRHYRDQLTVLSSMKEELEKQLVRLAKDASSRERIKKEMSKSVWPRIIESGPAETWEWPQYFIRSATENLASYVRPSEEASIFKTIMDSLQPSSPLTVHLKAIAGKKEISPEGKESENSRDDPEMDKWDQKGPERKPPEDGKAIGDDESGEEITKETQKPRGEKAGREDESDRDSVEDRVQKSSDDSKSGIDMDTGEETAQKHSGDDKSGEEFTEEMPTPPGEKAGREDKPNERLEKDRLPDTEHSGRPESEDKSTHPGSEASQQESPESAETPLQPEKEQLTDAPESDAAKGREADHPEKLEEYYLRNAGIVLCWPYLARLFENLDYIEDNNFKEPRYQERAVHLLGYIGSGKDQCEEHELVLAKFLCAWPLQMPIIKELELTDEEKDSADEMLGSLIDHWSVLKNTSVEGLRESFFNREGKLFKEDEQWRLIVEQESYDMLLDRLPYGISMIKLPWMNDLLRVDWM